MAGSNATLVEVPPTLNYARQNAALILSWPTNSTGYSLLFATNLPSSNWSTAAPPPVVAGDQYVVTNPVTGAERYYRLRKP